MAAGHGGARQGSGRKPKGSKSGEVAVTAPSVSASEAANQSPEPPAGLTPQARYRDALEYLEAVVRGDERPDGLRIAAAKCVLPFQAPKARAPVESPPPSALRKQAENATSRARADDWDQRSAAIRAKHAKGTMQ
jgi:hypothetical protein